MLLDRLLLEVKISVVVYDSLYMDIICGIIGDQASQGADITGDTRQSVWT